MTIQKLGDIAIKCPKCGNTQLSKGDTPETEDQATCPACGNVFSLKTEIAKIQKVASKAIADHLRKAFKGFK